MRSLLCVSLVFLFATSAAAQFGKNPDLRRVDPPADAKEGKAGDKKPAEPVAPVDAAGPAAAAPNAMFAAIDADGDGVISKTELRKAIAALKKLDTDNDGNITLAECGGGAVVPVGGLAGPGGESALWIERMMENDKNADGRLTADEVPDTLKPMLQGADQNGDGAIDRRELAAAMENGRNRLSNGAGGTFPGGPGALGAGGGRGNEAMARFMQYDRNGDGRLTSDEVPRQAKAMLQGGDLNGDGSIDAAELQAISARKGDLMRAWAAGVDPTAGAGAPGADKEGRNQKRPRN